MTYDHYKLDSGREDDEDERPDGCTCTMSRVWSNTTEPPHVVRDRWCPIHGRDPDYERERRMDDAREAARDIEEDCADDYRDCEDGDVGSAR